MADFVENDDSKFVVQIKSFSDGLNSPTTPNGSTLGFSGAECTEAKDDADYMKYVLQQQDKAKGFQQGYTKFKNGMRYGSADPVVEPVFDVPAVVPTAVNPNVEQRFRDKAAKAKASPAYSQTIGESWKIVAAVVSSTLGVPEFTVEIAAGHPLIKWKKKTADGVQIWKDDGTGFRLLDSDYKSPFVDKDDLPAVGQSKIWKYKLIYIVNDEAVGDFTAEASVTVKGI